MLPPIPMCACSLLAYGWVLLLVVGPPGSGVTIWGHLTRLTQLKLVIIISTTAPGKIPWLAALARGCYMTAHWAVCLEFCCVNPHEFRIPKTSRNFFPPYPESPGSTAAVRYLGGVIPWNSSGNQRPASSVTEMQTWGSWDQSKPSHLTVNLAGNNVSDGFLDQSMLSREGSWK